MTSRPARLPARAAAALLLAACPLAAAAEMRPAPADPAPSGRNDFTTPARLSLTSTGSSDHREGIAGSVADRPRGAGRTAITARATLEGAQGARAGSPYSAASTGGLR